jgi:hypothetical protein
MMGGGERDFSRGAGIVFLFQNGGLSSGSGIWSV